MFPAPRLRLLPPYPTRRSSDLTGGRANGAIRRLARCVLPPDTEEDRRSDDASSDRSPRSRSPRHSCWGSRARPRSEEHTSELQSLRHLVCRLLLEKKKKTNEQQRERRVNNKIILALKAHFKQNMALKGNRRQHVERTFTITTTTQWTKEELPNRTQ